MPPRGGTAWISDSIRVRPPPHKPPAQKSEKGKGRAKTPEPARSPAIRKLDELLAGLRSSSSHQNSTPDAGCFCQARTHQPSEYTPLCTTCGLILCTLHSPYIPCPSCNSPLLDAPSRAALIVQIEERREHTLAEEAVMRARAAEELRLAEGAFPALGGGGVSGGGASSAGGGGGKGGVLSFDGKTGRVRVEAYRVKEQGVEAAGDEGEDGVGRVPPPKSLREVQYLRVPRGPATRWAVSKDGQGCAAYVAERRGKGKAGGA